MVLLLVDEKGCLVHLQVFHYFFPLPSLKPRHTVLSSSIKDISTMHALVVIQQDYISLGHFDKLDILHGNFVHVFQILLGNIAIIAKEHVGLVDLRSTILESLCAVPIKNNDSHEYKKHGEL